MKDWDNIRVFIKEQWLIFFSCNLLLVGLFFSKQSLVLKFEFNKWGGAENSDSVIVYTDTIDQMFCNSYIVFFITNKE